MPICLKIIVHDSLVDGTRLGHLGLSYVPKHLTGYSGPSFMEALIQFERLTVWCKFGLPCGISEAIFLQYIKKESLGLILCGVIKCILRG